MPKSHRSLWTSREIHVRLWKKQVMWRHYDVVENLSDAVTRSLRSRIPTRVALFVFKLCGREQGAGLEFKVWALGDKVWRLGDVKGEQPPTCSVELDPPQKEELEKAKEELGDSLWAVCWHEGGAASNLGRDQWSRAISTIKEVTWRKVNHQKRDLTESEPSKEGLDGKWTISSEFEHLCETSRLVWRNIWQLVQKESGLWNPLGLDWD